MKNKLFIGALLLTGCTETPRSLLPDLGTPDLSVIQPPPADLSGMKYEPVDFAVAPVLPPTITAISPASMSTLPVGTASRTLTITGTGFITTPGTVTTVAINNIETVATVVSATQIKATVPNSPGTFGKVPVTVINPNGGTATNSTAFSYYLTNITFTQAQYLDNSGSNLRGAQLGDFNGDGYIDAVVSNISSANYQVYLGDGFGGFTQFNNSAGNGFNFGTTNGISSQTSRPFDLNNDGHLDLVMTGQNNNLVAYYMSNLSGTNAIATNNSGTLSGLGNDTYGTSATPVSYALADINNDGYADIVTANLNSNNLGVFLATQASVGNWFSNGQSTPITAPNGSPTRVSMTDYSGKLLDINGDGKTDLVVSLQTNGGPALAVYFGTGQGSAPFNPSSPLNYGTNNLNQAPQWFDVGDMNGDGYYDVVLANVNTNTIQVYLGTGQTSNTFNTPLTPVVVGLNPSQVALSDVNQDGHLDAIVTNQSSDNVSVLLGKGDGTFQNALEISSVHIPFTVYTNASTKTGAPQILDLNNDGKPDFVVINQQNEAQSTTGYLTTYINTSQ